LEAKGKPTYSSRSSILASPKNFPLQNLLQSLDQRNVHPVTSSNKYIKPLVKTPTVVSFFATKKLLVTSQMVSPPSKSQSELLSVKKNGFLSPTITNNKNPVASIGGTTTTNVIKNSFLSKTFSNISVAMENSVAKSSRISYSVGWHRWLKFTDLVGTDPFLRKTPDAWSQWSTTEDGSLFASFPVTCVAGFLCFLVNDNFAPVQPSTAINYLSAVRFNLMINGVAVSFMDDSIVVQKTRTGLMNLWRSKEGNSLADKKTLPISVDMIFSMKLQKSSISEFACFTAAIFGYHVLCRVSEYLYTPNTKHHILARSVVFQSRGINNEVVHVLSSDVHCYPKESIVGCYLTIKDSKNDPSGEGSRYPYTRILVRSPGCLYDFTEVLYDWAAFARPVPNAPFFSSGTFKLSPVILNKWLSSVAVRFSLDPKRISSHSLRIGGASNLAASGVNDYVIQKMGRWKSLCFLQYIRLASGAFSKAADNLSNSSIFSVNDVRLYNPSVV
jgi:hypothetical protein